MKLWFQWSLQKFTKKSSHSEQNKASWSYGEAQCLHNSSFYIIQGHINVILLLFLLNLSKLKEFFEKKSYFKPLKNAETGRQKLWSRFFRMCIENSELATQSKI